MGRDIKIVNMNGINCGCLKQQLRIYGRYIEIVNMNGMIMGFTVVF